MVREGMIHALKESGVEEIDSLGQIFDPNKHQAVQTLPLQEGQQPDEIIQVLQKVISYMIAFYDQQWLLLHNKIKIN